MERALRFHFFRVSQKASYNCRMSDKPGLRPQQAVGQALRDVARHILAEGRTAVEDKKRVEAVAVHDFRAAMKSWRAFLRLVEGHLEAAQRRVRTQARDTAHTVV